MILLKKYTEDDFIQDKRASFLLYFIISALVITVLVLLTTIYRHLTQYHYVRLETTLPVACLIIVYVFCIYVLYKGRFFLSANTMIISSLVAIWTVMFFDTSALYSKIDTIVFVFAALTMLPLIVNSRKMIILYGALNLFISIIFITGISLNETDPAISSHIFIELLVDISAALVFSIIIHYNVYSINTVALVNAKDEIEYRKKIVNELQYHKDNLEKLVKEKTLDIEAANDELNATNEELFEKNEIISNQNTELKAIIQYLKETQSHLVQAEKMASLGVLTAGVAHEINNPLQYLAGAYYGLNAYFKKHASHDKETTGLLLSTINTGISRISTIVKGLNQFSRDNSNYDENCDIHLIIDNCLAVLHNKIKNKAVISKYYSPDNKFIKGNTGKLHQVFMNIFNNSIQAIENKGLISITTTFKDKDVEIEVIDTGCGISKENLPKIFDPFYTTKDPGKGTGLGLSITYALIQEHKGKLNFESQVNKGTKVIITLHIQ